MGRRVLRLVDAKAEVGRGTQGWHILRPGLERCLVLPRRLVPVVNELEALGECQRGHVGGKLFLCFRDGRERLLLPLVLYLALHQGNPGLRHIARQVLARIAACSAWRGCPVPSVRGRAKADPGSPWHRRTQPGTRVSGARFVSGFQGNLGSLARRVRRQDALQVELDKQSIRLIHPATLLQQLRGA